MPFISDMTRPVSQATDVIYTDIEDDSEYDDRSLQSVESYDPRRRSETTISSYGEVETPASEIEEPFAVIIKPVEGPSGPHLFRASQISADFTFETLQLPPPNLKQDVKATPLRPETALSQKTTRSEQDDRQRSLSVPAKIPGLPLDVYQWTPEDVVDWMYNAGFELAIIEKFEENDISGSVLLDMQFENLKELGIQSFGKRHQLWNSISALKGGDCGISPVPTPFLDTSKACTLAHKRTDEELRDACADSPAEDNQTPLSAGGHKKRRGRKHRHHNDVVTPGESISIVAIEQLMPKPHRCSKGENCSKWRKQQRLIKRIQEENGWPVSPKEGGHIVITGDPGNATTADNLLGNVRRQSKEDRPVSDALPSVVASSDLLGPGQLPEFALHENMLQQLGQRDPQENIRNYLHLQHVTPIERPQTPELEMFPEQHFQAPPQHCPQHSLSDPFMPPLRRSLQPHENLKNLPKLAIPRAATASPNVMRRPDNFRSPMSARSTRSVLSPCRTATVSPATVYRYGTPASEMDLPVTQMANGPIGRQASQSVPPDMQYNHAISITRPNSRTDWRRSKSVVPTSLLNNQSRLFSPVSPLAEEDESSATMSSSHQTSQQSPLSPAQQRYGADTTHAGFMKKRKNKLLRHEWQDAHFRLRGGQLAMHPTDRLSSVALVTLDLDDFTVACCSAPSNNKLTAALRSLKLMDEKKTKDTDPTAFAFQLVPEEKQRSKSANGGKTHHFAVKNRDERMEWMRELMLAKALRQRKDGFVVEVNGNQP